MWGEMVIGALAWLAAGLLVARRMGLNNDSRDDDES